MEIVRVFAMLREYPHVLVANISELCNALGKCLADPYPELKQVKIGR